MTDLVAEETAKNEKVMEDINPQQATTADDCVESVSNPAPHPKETSAAETAQIENQPSQDSELKVTENEPVQNESESKETPSASDATPTVQIEKPVDDAGGENDEKQEEGGFVIPEKEILLPGEIETVWEKSQAYHDLLGFIMAMSDAIKGKKLRDEYHISPTVQNIVKILDTLDTYIDEVPPVDQPQRFGNKAYRDWFQRLETDCERLVREALPQEHHAAVPEIAVYLRESCGNSTRIDYGTGHEISFLAFLCCLYKISALTEQDAVATVFTVFNRYLTLMRRLQQTYRMEPAGSQGVWNLDDYSFVPFIWGSAQLIEHQRLKPKHYPDPEMCVAFAKDYMLFAAVQYIHQVKTGPFHEHSNQLWNISGVKLWSKVHSGLIKMYKAEVLNKFPVIQHFLFGSLMSVEPAQDIPPM